MTDVPPMAPCPVRKSGQHHLSYMLPEDHTGDITAICDNCGSARRLPFSGPLREEGSLDDMAAEQIVARLGWSLGEVRE